VLVTLDCCAIGARTISQYILNDSPDDFMPRLRKRVEDELGVPRLPGERSASPRIRRDACSVMTRSRSPGRCGGQAGGGDHDARHRGGRRRHENTADDQQTNGHEERDRLLLAARAAGRRDRAAAGRSIRDRHRPHRRLDGSRWPCSTISPATSWSLPQGRVTAGFSRRHISLPGRADRRRDGHFFLQGATHLMEAS